jgi:hypothetical protein
MQDTTFEKNLREVEPKPRSRRPVSQPMPQPQPQPQPQSVICTPMTAEAGNPTTTEVKTKGHKKPKKKKKGNRRH